MKKILALSLLACAQLAQACKADIFLTFDTGSHDQAASIAQLLRTENIKATFFLANEKTVFGYTSLSDETRSFWQGLVRDGHAFASHTYNHTYLAKGAKSLRMKPQFGADAGKESEWSAAQLCDEINLASARFKTLTGASMLTLWRAPGGRVNDASLAAARACGWQHTGWSPEGFIGEELNSKNFSDERLLANGYKRIYQAAFIEKKPVVTMAHLGVFSRKTPWAQMVLAPMIKRLKADGACFKTLDEHSDMSKGTRVLERQSVYGFTH